MVSKIVNFLHTFAARFAQLSKSAYASLRSGTVSGCSLLLIATPSRPHTPCAK